MRLPVRPAALRRRGARGASTAAAPPQLLRSALYVPGSNARALAKAVSGATGADCVIVDLEDAVHPDAKSEARAAAAAAVQQHKQDQHRCRLVVRINAAGTPWHADDAAAMEPLMDRVTLLIPKFEDPQRDFGSITRRGDRARLWAMVETPRGVLGARATAAAVGCLVAGMEDLAAELHLALPVPVDRAPLVHSLAAIVLAAKAEGTLCLDGVCTALGDAEVLAQQTRQGRALGFDGKTCIHPNQTATVNTTFSPSDEEVRRAEAVLAAWDAAGSNGKAHPGVAVCAGRLVEELHARQARRTLALHRAAAGA